MAAVSGFPSFLSLFIRRTSFSAASSTFSSGRRSRPSIFSTAMKQVLREGACMSRTLSAERRTATSCTFSVAEGRWPISSGFLCTAAIWAFSDGVLNFRIMSGSARTAASRAFSGIILFSVDMVVFLVIHNVYGTCTMPLPGCKVQRFVAIMLRRSVTENADNPDCSPEVSAEKNSR